MTMEEYKALRNKLVAEGLAEREKPQTSEKPQRPPDAKMSRGEVPPEEPPEPSEG